MYDFITDLDAYFCEKYANYDKLCVLPGYKMPKMQDTEVRADGRTYAYTLPANTMRLATQEKKDEVLAILKKQIVDKTFSFSFRPYSGMRRIRDKFSKFAFNKNLKIVLGKYNLTEKEAGELLDVAEEIWTGICAGKYAPTKNLIFSLALAAHFSYDDTVSLLTLCEFEFNYAVEKDVVVSYLLNNKVYNRDMIDAAFAEYKISNLFLK